MINPTSFDNEQTFRTLAEKVREGIRRDILGGGYRPGQRIGQETLARQHGTSRIPIREALRQLASEGLVVLEPHVGAKVATLDRRELDEVYQIREQLEPFAIAKSVPLLTDADRDVLRNCVDEMDVAASADEISRWI